MIEQALSHSQRTIFVILILQITGLVYAKNLSERDEFQQTLTFPGTRESQTLEIDNVFGSVTVEGYSGDKVHIHYTQILTADSPAAMTDALRDTRLAITQKDNHIQLYAEAPYRNWERHRNRRFGYQARYDIVVKVPSQTRLLVSTVNEGDIHIRNMTQFIEVSNVNGSLTLEDIASACHATTVNGKINVQFQQTPDQDCRFKTVNGDISLRFPAEPHGDYHLKTFNGEMFSDFAYEPIHSQSHLQETKGRLTKITVNDTVRIRIGAGGPKFLLDTLNGDIFIRES